MTRLISARALLHAGAAFAAMTAAPIYAQSAPTETPVAQEQDVADGDIVVTARRREETLLDVPIAVTAFSAARLEQIGAVDLTDLQNVTPNTTLKNARGTNSTLAAFIRGVGQQDPVPGFEAGIGIYLDDVYLNRPQAAVLDVYEVERIEVLRGPQGTLYGRNTIGGAVKYVTKKLPDSPEANFKASYGSFNQADGIVSLSAPIGSLFKVGVAGARLTRDGFGRNTNLNIDNYNKNVWAARGTIEFESPDQRMSIRLTGDYTEDKSNARNGSRLITSLLSNTPVQANAFDTRAGLNNPRQNIQAGGLSLVASAELNDRLTLKSISAFRKDRSLTPIDFDALPAVDVDVPAVYRNEQTSQEFQLAYKSDKLNGLIGFYYLGAKASTGFDVLLSTTLANFNAYTKGDVRTETSSIFGDFTYDFTDQFSLSLGGRYTWDERSSYVFKASYFGVTPEFGGNPTIVGAPSTDFRGVAKFKRFTPRASLNFKPTPDHLLYASYSEGFKGGGFDPRGSGTSAPDVNQDGVRSYQEIYNYLLFRPEIVKSYEVGYKGSLFDKRLNIALNGFYSDYADVQVPGSVGCIIGGVQSFCGITTNAAKANIKGVELETTGVLARGFAGPGSNISLSGTLGYIDAKYKTFIGPTGTDVANVRVFQNTPDWTLSSTLAGTVPVGDGKVNANTTLSYRSLTHQFETASPFLDQPGYALWDANLTYSFGRGGRYSVGVHAKNITNKIYKTAGYQYIRTDLAGNPINLANVPVPNGPYVATLGKEGIATAFYGNPRQIFGTITAKF
ncbi:TonB-dependent receptor [Sphingomonas sp. HMP6]|uniref:TonB-dependent receptor n=1 Tax=Sphingomonas sp. HMP6 TaxID=1517551 RepID=UPI0015964AA6|nr:TonB-dependent receptor [Sphingomonas sp. HMP6]BCA59268.1 TonB-dependent receptor [Sphingomonas sp. HMP6]